MFVSKMKKDQERLKHPEEVTLEETLIHHLLLLKQLAATWIN